MRPLLTSIIASALLVFPSSLPSRSLPRASLVPSYETSLSQVLVNAEPHYGVPRGLLEALPTNTRITVLATSATTLRPTRPATIVRFPFDSAAEHVWSQDLFSVVRTADATRIVLPPRYSASFVKTLQQAGYSTRMSAAYFEGGNVFVDECRGRRFLFAGEGNFRTPDLMPYTLTQQRRAERELRDAFDVDAVITLPLGRKESTFFHIDQGVLPLRRCEVAVGSLSAISFDDAFAVADSTSALPRKSFIDPVLSTFLREQPERTDPFMLVSTLFALDDDLAQTRAIFRTLGYSVQDFPLNPYQVLRHESYLNSVPFRDGSRTKLLMPTFPDEYGSVSLTQGPNRDAIDFFTKRGFAVTPVRNETWPYGGNLHCLVNVIR